MICKILRHALAAVAALALVFAISPVSTAETSKPKIKGPTTTQKASPKQKRAIDSGPIDYQFRKSVPW